MGKEIERKFLVSGESWRKLGKAKHYRQGYLSATPERNVRVRIAGDRAFLTIKGKSDGMSRLEYEYTIPIKDAGELLDRLCLKPLIEKTRSKIDYQGFTWEVDEFQGENEGLIMAEVELKDENQSVDLPDWIGREVTGDPRYYNASLIQNPYKKWRDKT